MSVTGQFVARSPEVRPAVKPEDSWSRFRPLPPSPQTQGRPCGRPPPAAILARQPHDGRRGTGSPCRIVLSPWRCGRPRRSDCDEVWATSNLRVVSAPTSSADSYPCALHVSRQAGRVVGGRRPRPRTACGGPAGYWRRGRQHAGGGPGLQAPVRPVAPAMPRVGRSPGRACRPGGSGSNHPGLETGSRPKRPSILGRGQGWAARPALKSGGTSRRRPGPLYPLPPAGSSRPARAVSRGRFRRESTVNVVLLLQRAA
jgi:hypothetical protein